MLKRAKQGVKQKTLTSFFAKKSKLNTSIIIINDNECKDAQDSGGLDADDNKCKGARDSSGRDADDNSLDTSGSSVHMEPLQNDIGGYIGQSISMSADKRYTLLTSPWTPPSTYKFPVIREGSHNRSFQSN